jgi:hypothetical protein
MLAQSLVQPNDAVGPGGDTVDREFVEFANRPNTGVVVPCSPGQPPPQHLAHLNHRDLSKRHLPNPHVA